MVWSLDHEVSAVSLEELETQPHGQSTLCPDQAPVNTLGDKSQVSFPGQQHSQCGAVGALVRSLPH